MLTLNVRQITALSIVAPGTLALIDDNFPAPRFGLTEHDRCRTGVWSITVDQHGNVTRHFDQAVRNQTGYANETTPYQDLLRQRAETIAECLALGDDA